MICYNMRFRIPQGAHFSGIEMLWQPVVETMCKSKQSAAVKGTHAVAFWVIELDEIV